MALMIDNKPTEYKGEALVWGKLSSLLPNDVVVYNHREVVDDREFDFALLIKNVSSKILGIVIGIFVVVIGITSFMNYKRTAAETIEVYEGL